MAIVLAILFKILPALTGLAAIYWGYRLFIKGIDTKGGDVAAVWGDYSLVMKRFTPGAFFAIIGASISIAVVFKGIDVRLDDGSQAVNSVAQTEDDNEGRGLALPLPMAPEEPTPFQQQEYAPQAEPLIAYLGERSHSVIWAVEESGQLITQDGSVYFKTPIVMDPPPLDGSVHFIMNRQAPGTDPYRADSIGWGRDIAYFQWDDSDSGGDTILKYTNKREQNMDNIGGYASDPEKDPIWKFLNRSEQDSGNVGGYGSEE